MSSRINFEDFLKTKKINEKALFKYFNLIFDDLYERVENNKVKDEKISMETMRIFFQYPEIIFKLIFSALKIPFENRISKVQFNEIIFKLYCSDNKEKMKLYFNIFSPDEKQLIYCENIKIILFNFHLINYSNNFNYLNKVINNLNLKENMSFLQWEELNSRNSDLFYLINFFIENTKPFNDFLINELFCNEIKNNIIKNELKNNNLENKITKHFKLYLNSLKKEKDDLFFNDLTMNDHKVKTKDFYEEDISNKNKILDFSDNNMKLQTSKSYSNLRINNLLLQQCDNITITGNSSTQCEDDYQFLHLITPNKSSLISSQNIIQIPINKFIKAFIYSKNEKKFIEKEIDIIDNIIVTYSDGIVNQIIDLRYSFIETNLSNVKHKEKNYQRIYIIAKFSNSKNNAFKLFFDSNFEYENFLLKISSKDLYSTFSKNYELKEIIGIGGFGKVYKALNNETGEILAVKIINKKEINYNQRVNSYKNEILFFNMLTHINHENIIKAIELYENCENICCIYEYVPQNLTQFILCNKNNMNVNIIKRISYEMISALSFMKKIGLIHQDLKTENVMVKYDNNNINNLNIKLIDFGLSKIMLINETCSGQFGTPNYMAPELTYYDDYNYKIDIWSLGIILYYIKYNKLPFDDDSKLKEKILKNIKYQKIRFGNSICKFESNDEKIFQNIILNCLIRNPDDRITIESLSDNQWLHIY